MFDGTQFDEQATPIERRLHRRQRTYLHGKLVFLTNSLSSDCTIRNLSNGGGKFLTQSLDMLPDHPVVIITRTGMAHEALTVWRDACEFGVEFQTSFDLNRWVPPRLTHAYRLWIENLPR